jgi:hypothetical protein
MVPSTRAFFLSIVLARYMHLPQANRLDLKRCVSYLREFMSHPSSGSRGLTGFREQAANSGLWCLASQPEKAITS